MRLLTLPALAVLFSLTDASSKSRQPPVVAEYELPGPFVDGSILTFYFYYGTSDSYFPGVTFDFFNEPYIRFDKTLDEISNVPARIVFHREKGDYPVESYSQVNDVVLNKQNNKTKLPSDLPKDGTWRVDIIKFSNTSLTVFVHEFFSDVRTFAVSLDDIKSVYIRSNYVWSMEVKYLAPMDKNAPKTLDTFFRWQYEYFPIKNLTRINKFPVGSSIDMVVGLRAVGGHPDIERPALLFIPIDSQKEFYSITHYKIPKSERDKAKKDFPNELNLIIDDIPTGDLKHMQITRTTKDEIEVRIFDKPKSDSDFWIPRCSLPNSCTAKLEKSTLGKSGTTEHVLDHPFDIQSRHAAIIFRLEQKEAKEIPKPKRKWWPDESGW